MMDVQLYVYDLSKGLARQLSASFLGTHIDAVYHTSLCFGGIEYFFGAGIQTCYPGTTHHGQPMEIIPMGRTELELDVVLEYLESLKTIYTPESYDLFAHNCNNFSNDFAMFLLGKGIPSHITSLPQTVLNTPFGQMLKPQLDRAMREVTQAPVSMPAIPQSAPIRNGVTTGAGSHPYANGSGSTPRQISIGKVHNVKRLAELEALLNSAKKTCAVIFFTSSTCAPCKIAYPAYEELALEAGNKAVLIKIDLNQAMEISSSYKVRATPTFMTFLSGEKLDEWSGADPNRLKAQVRMLIQMAHPPHPHTNLRLRTLQRPHNKPVTYTKIPPLEKLIVKLGADGKTSSVVALKQFVETRSLETAASASVPCLPSISSFILSSLDKIPANNLFPLIDLLRLALVDTRVSGYFAEEHGHATILGVVSHVNNLGEACPYTLRIVTLQMACNLFTCTLYPPQLLGNESLCTPLIQLVSSSLLDEEHAPVRISAASLAFNIAAFNHLQRLELKDNLLPESAQVELVASLLEAVGREESKEGLKGIVFALGLLAYGCPQDGEVRDLLKVMSAQTLVEGKKNLFGDSDKALADEVKQVVA